MTVEEIEVLVASLVEDDRQGKFSFQYMDTILSGPGEYTPEEVEEANHRHEKFSQQLEDMIKIRIESSIQELTDEHVCGRLKEEGRNYADLTEQDQRSEWKTEYEACREFVDQDEEWIPSIRAELTELLQSWKWSGEAWRPS